MNKQIADLSPQKTARLAGFLYLSYVLVSVVADLFGRFVFPAAPETLATMSNHDFLFRLGFLGSLLATLLFLFAAWALYLLLKPVNANLSLLFLLLNLGGFCLWCFSLMDLYTGLMFSRGSELLKVFSPDQLRAQAALFIDLRRSGASMAQLPYGFWLFPLGYLVLRSGFLPKLLGVLLIADGCGLFLYIVQRFLFPELVALSYPCMALGFVAEMALALWLSIMGIGKARAAGGPER